MDTNNSDMNDKSLDVGYGKPPKHSQWTKGQSGNRKGRPKKRKLFRLSDAIAAKLDQEIRVKGGRRDEKLPTLRLLLRGIVEKAAIGDNRAAQVLFKISEMGEPTQPPTEPDWMVLTYEEGMARGQRRLTEEFFLEQERKIAQWKAELRKGGKSVQQMLQLELMRRVPATRNGKQVKVPIIDVIAARLRRDAANNVQVFKLLLKMLPQKNYKPDYGRIEVLRPTRREADRWGAIATPRPGP